MRCLRLDNLLIQQRWMSHHITQSTCKTDIKNYNFEFKNPAAFLRIFREMKAESNLTHFLGRKEDFNTIKLRKSAELQVRIELTTLEVLVRML